MALRSPTDIVTAYKDKEVYPREPIVTTHLDAAMDTQDYCLRANRIYVSTCFRPQITTNTAGRDTLWRTSLYSKHKAGASFGTTSIGRVLVLLYEYVAAAGGAMTQYEVAITDGTNTDTTVITSFSGTGFLTPHWEALSISTVVAAADDQSAKTNLRIEVGNLNGLGNDDAYLCGVYIAKDQ